MDGFLPSDEHITWTWSELHLFGMLSESSSNGSMVSIHFHVMTFVGETSKLTPWPARPWPVHPMGFIERMGLKGNCWVILIQIVQETCLESERLDGQDFSIVVYICRGGGFGSLIHARCYNNSHKI